MEVNEMYNDYKRLFLEYECGTDYTPLCVSLSIRPPLFMANPWIFFDGIISYLCMREALGEEYWTLPTHETVDTSLLRLPLKQTSDIYHASIGILHKPVLKKNTIYKRFTDKETYHLNKKQQTGKIRTNAGHFKDFMINLPLVVTDKVHFYCNGDKKDIKRLLGNLTRIGKKTSIGGGHIKQVNIQETDKDYSFYKDGYCLKPLPNHVDVLPVQPGDKWQRCTYKPPYWESNNTRLCRVPPNQLIGEENIA